MFLNMIIGIFMAIFIEKATNLGWTLTIVFLVAYVLVQIYRTMLGLKFGEILQSGMSIERMRYKVVIPAAIGSSLMWSLITSIIYNLNIFN